MWSKVIQCTNKKIFTQRLPGTNFLDFFEAKVVMVCEIN